MSEREFESYLRLMSRFLGLSEPQREAIRAELRGHMEERLDELMRRGYTRDEAITAALDEFGDAAALASEFGRIGRRRKWIMRTTAGTIGIAATILIVSFLLPLNRPQVPAPSFTQAGERGIASPEPAKEAPGVPLAGPLVAASESEADRHALEILAAAIPSVDIPEGTAFQEAIQLLQGWCPVSLCVNWRRLEEAGIGRVDEIAPVHLKNAKLQTVIEVVLDAAGASGVQLDYVVADGIIRISTVEDLSRRTIVRVYDCHDLIDGPITEVQRTAINDMRRALSGAASVSTGPGPVGVSMMGSGGPGGVGAAEGSVGGWVTAVLPARPTGGGGPGGAGVAEGRPPGYGGGGYGGGYGGGMGGMGGYGGGMGGYGTGGYGGAPAAPSGGGNDPDSTQPLDPDLLRFVNSVLHDLRDENADEFAELIRTVVEPGTWRGSEGSSGGSEGVVGSLSIYDGMMVVRHTWRAHREVVEFMDLLRQTKGARAARGIGSATQPAIAAGS